ncbi:MAG: YjbE family putative metal transport protein [Rhizobiales bacterium]|nr:YjbE family putative metal transport protein [Hyphomicrobiales bacterium]
MLQWLSDHAVELVNIIIIDLTLAGDNAIVVGMAAARVAPALRAKVIFWGIAGAVVLRVLFSGVAVQLLQIIGLTLAGGLLLLFVCWKMYRQLVEGNEHSIDEVEAQVHSTTRPPGEVGFWSALWTIIIADVSMSLDNVLAVAGVAQGAQEPVPVLIIGLGLAIILMAVASTYIAKLLAKYPWIAWIGLFIILWVALDMIYTDSHKITCAAYGVGCSETLWHAVLHRLGLGPGGGG